ncbi:oxidative damage protection protein [Candidatus Erwinia haradaeae]|uniref:Probable Fe(2+)-trafficking protein n=1 Tax=Candidatus Erwinia haradaeae TaxID=1922217 RepID=A0A451D1T1_9GAMM|nr:oxidative damage protection protein [Candidatus Erwinia haradaeae]VFP79565.1 Probable Fe(2+)-trafficking protein [Candidatus Erwinia haradaeae]
MSRMIFCKFLGRMSFGQDYQLYPGDIGKRIFNEISQEAWEKWMGIQTMLINERRLSMLDITHRKEIEKEMIKFLFEDHQRKIKRYIPTEEE